MPVSHFNRALDRAICTTLVTEGAMTVHELTRSTDLHERFQAQLSGGLCAPLLRREEVYRRLRSLANRGITTQAVGYDGLWWVVSLVEHETDA